MGGLRPLLISILSCPWPRWLYSQLTCNLVKPTNWVKHGILMLTPEFKQPETLMFCSLRVPGGALADLRAASRRGTGRKGTGVLSSRTEFKKRKWTLSGTFPDGC